MKVWSEEEARERASLLISNLRDGQYLVIGEPPQSEAELAFVTGMLASWAAEVAFRMKAPMECGHPTACANVEVGYKTTAGAFWGATEPETLTISCSICAELAAAANTAQGET